MPNPLLNVSCRTTYTAAATIQDVWNSNGGYYQISSGTVYMQMQYGTLGESYWTDEQFLLQGASGSVGPECIGMKFRNGAVVPGVGQATVNSVVSAGISHGDEPTLSVISSGTDPSATFTPVGEGHVTGTHGTPTVLSATLSTAGIVVRANTTNTGKVYIGDANVNVTNGYILSAGDAVGFDTGDPSKVYFDVDTTGDGVSWMAVG